MRRGVAAAPADPAEVSLATAAASGPRVAHRKHVSFRRTRDEGGGNGISSSQCAGYFNRGWKAMEKPAIPDI